jgi:hypothetical protein
MWISRGVQRLLHRLRRALDDEQISARRPFRLVLALLPMAQRVDAESESTGEFLLGIGRQREQRNAGSAPSSGPLSCKAEAYVPACRRYVEETRRAAA